MCKPSNIPKLRLGSNLLEDVLSRIPGGEGEGLMLGNVSVRRKKQHVLTWSACNISAIIQHQNVEISRL